MPFNLHDRTILRDLAAQVAEIAARPEMADRRRRWVDHNGLRSNTPMMLIFPEGAWEELLPDSDLDCQADAARAVEWELRRRIYTFNHFQDDSVIEAEWVVEANLKDTGWGLEPVKIASSEQRGAFRIQPILRDRSDLRKLTHPDLLYDPAAHEQRLQEMRDLFGDILAVKRKGVAHISYHLWSQYIYLRGETDYLTDFLDAPDMIHAAMAFFTEGHKRISGRWSRLTCYRLTMTIPITLRVVTVISIPCRPRFRPRLCPARDMWASAESQELTGVSPKMHSEFALEYEQEVLAPFLA